MNLQNLLGVWKSRYIYDSITRGALYASEHYVKAHIDGDQLVFETVAESNESYLIIRLHFETNVFMHHVASGSWQEVTDPNGYYEGQVYGGTIQLVVDEKAKKMTGKYTDYKKQGVIGSGDWTLTYVGPELTEPIEPLHNNQPIGPLPSAAK